MALRWPVVLLGIVLMVFGVLIGAYGLLTSRNVVDRQALPTVVWSLEP